jgi:hypothetical protein
LVFLWCFHGCLHRFSMYFHVISCNFM